MTEPSNGDKFATLVFRIFIGIIGLALLCFLFPLLIDLADVKTVVAVVFILVLFLGYALGGSKLAAKLLHTPGNHDNE